MSKEHQQHRQRYAIERPWSREENEDPTTGNVNQEQESGSLQQSNTPDNVGELRFGHQIFGESPIPSQRARAGQPHEATEFTDRHRQERLFSNMSRSPTPPRKVSPTFYSDTAGASVRQTYQTRARDPASPYKDKSSPRLKHEMDSSLSIQEENSSDQMEGSDADELPRAQTIRNSDTALSMKKRGATKVVNSAQGTYYVESPNDMEDVPLDGENDLGPEILETSDAPTTLSSGSSGQEGMEKKNPEMSLGQSTSQLISGLSIKGKRALKQAQIMGSNAVKVHGKNSQVTINALNELARSTVSKVKERVLAGEQANTELSSTVAPHQQPVYQPTTTQALPQRSAWSNIPNPAVRRTVSRSLDQNVAPPMQPITRTASTTQTFPQRPAPVAPTLSSTMTQYPGPLRGYTSPTMGRMTTPPPLPLPPGQPFGQVFTSQCHTCTRPVLVPPLRPHTTPTDGGHAPVGQPPFIYDERNPNRYRDNQPESGISNVMTGLGNLSSFVRFKSAGLRDDLARRLSSSSSVRSESRPSWNVLDEETRQSRSSTGSRRIPEAQEQHSTSAEVDAIGRELVCCCCWPIGVASRIYSKLHPGSSGPFDRCIHRMSKQLTSGALLFGIAFYIIFFMIMSSLKAASAF